MKRKGMGLDNRGATLVFSIVTIMFITILASLILSLAVSNFKIKAVDYKTRQDFYSAEVAADEIYTGIGTYAVEFLGQAYNQALSQMVVATHDSSQFIMYSQGTDLNKVFREEYMARLVSYLLDDAAAYSIDSVKSRIFSSDADVVNAFNTEINDRGYAANVLDKLKACVTGNADNTNIEILTTSEPKIMFEAVSASEPTFVINNVKVTYNNGTSVSEETFDIRLKFPDWSLYVKRQDLDNPYINYTLIGRNGLDFSANTIETITGGIYGGGTAKGPSTDSVGGINISSAQLSITPESGEIEGAVVSGGDIIVESSVTANAAFNVSNGRTWCDNIVTPAGRTVNEVRGASITLDGSTKTYVRDDLEISGDNSNVLINGDYYGYGINITESTGSSNNNAAKSSAIIVNGSKADITVNPASKLFLAGRAYINIGLDGIVDYVTGESVALKGNQQAYLVPSEWMISGKTNPCEDSAYSAFATNVSGLVDSSKIPGTLSALLDPSEPFVSKRARSGGIYWFIYFNFKDSDSVVTYIKNAAAGAYDVNGAAISSVIKSNDSTILETRNVNVVTGNAITSGAVSASNGSSVNVSGSFRTSEITMTSHNNYENRYELMKHLLVSVPDDDIVYDKRTANGRTYDLQVFSNDLTDNYIDKSLLQSAPYKNVDEIVTYDGESCRVIYMDNEGSGEYTYNDVSSMPVIIVCTGDVVIESGFRGLVVSFGKITVKRSAVMTADPVLVDKILSSAIFSGAGVKVGEVFRYYKSSTSSMENMDAIQYSDVIRYENWRKG